MTENDRKREKLVNIKNRVCQRIYDRGYKREKPWKRKTNEIFEKRSERENMSGLCAKIVKNPTENYSDFFPG
jgi:hypothetical protein